MQERSCKPNRTSEPLAEADRPYQASSQEQESEVIMGTEPQDQAVKGECLKKLIFPVSSGCLN